MQKEIKAKISELKQKFKKKVEDSFGSLNTRQMWKDVNVMTGYKPGNRNIRADDSRKLAEELNEYYTRFDKYDFGAEQQAILNTVREKEGRRLEIEELEVQTAFDRINTRSACGPDNITGRVLKACSMSLAPVFHRLFQKSLDSGHIPTLWKTAVIVPVAKKPHPIVYNDYRPVALTSVAFKCLERLVLKRLLAETRPFQDPLQFAYSPNRNTEDAITLLLHSAYKHLEIPKTYVRVLFLDFSSAFNTIQPHLMLSKLLEMKVNPTIITWIFCFLTARPQRVRITDGNSEVWSRKRQTNTGAPQGCVLSPALFTIYTSDCRCQKDNVLQIKFSDDTSIAGLISNQDEGDYMSAVTEMVSWCDSNFLLLNVSKTKELIVDFRRNPPPHEPLTIKGEQVETVMHYKYLGIILDRKLDWTEHSLALRKRGNQRLYFLKKLRSFDISKQILRVFYRATLESVLCYGSLCFFDSLRTVDGAKLAKLTKTAGDVIGEPVVDLQVLHERKAVKRVRSILADPTHPLHGELAAQMSSRAGSKRLLSMRARTDRFCNSFLPAAIRLLNQQR